MTQSKPVSIFIIISLFALSYFTSCDKKNSETDSIGVLIEKTVEKLISSPYIEFQFHYELSGFLKNSDTPHRGYVRIQPQKIPDSYGFDYMYVRATENSENRTFELSKIANDIYYYQHENDTIFYSPIHRLGSPLYSSRVKYTMLLYQYLPVLRDYNQYNPVFGAKEIVNGKEVQEIIFNIEQHNFYVRFWVYLNSYEVYKIVNLQSNGSESGEIIYYIDNFKTYSVKQEAASFLYTKSNRQTLKEYSTGGPIIGEVAPRWTLTSLDSNKTISLNELKGNIVVIDFWATWCKPCLESMPGINNLYLEFKNKGVKFIGITYNDNGNPLEYVKREGFTYKFLAGNENVYKQYGLNRIGIPTLFIIDKKGNVVDFESGYQGEATINRIRGKIKQLLKT